MHQAGQHDSNLRDDVHPNECFVKPHLLRVLAQDSWPAAPVDLICMMWERWSQSPRTRRSPLATSSMTEAGSWPAGVSRSVLSRVTKAVTLTTESLGRPEMAAGRKTLPGMVARAVLRSEEHTSELQSLRHLVCR